MIHLMWVIHISHALKRQKIHASTHVRVPVGPWGGTLADGPGPNFPGVILSLLVLSSFVPLGGDRGMRGTCLSFFWFVNWAAIISSKLFVSLILAPVLARVFFEIIKNYLLRNCYEILNFTFQTSDLKTCYNLKFSSLSYYVRDFEMIYDEAKWGDFWTIPWHISNLQVLSW